MYWISEYLAQRANMKPDDPKFDKDFWELYFRRVDKTENKDKSDELARLLGLKPDIKWFIHPVKKSA